MTQNTSDFLVKAQGLLLQADQMLAIGLDEAAGRTAYLAGFHAAQAFTFAANGKVSKSHKGVQTEFLRLTKDDPRIDPEMRAFLPRTYDLKTIADYETGPGVEISKAEAAQAIEAGKQFVARITELLEAGNISETGLD